MGIEITHIDCPKEWESVNDWDSHRELLWFCITQMPDAKICEFGMGEGSTPMLLQLSRHILVSVENNREWLYKYVQGYKTIYVTSELGEHKAYKGKKHIVYEDYTFILKWISDSIGRRSEAIVFVDNAPAENRLKVINLIKNRVEVIVVHDTEPGAEYVYGLSEILSTFKYRIDYRPEGKPHTTAVSNTIDITKWINQHSTSFSTVDEEKSMNP